MGVVQGGDVDGDTLSYAFGSGNLGGAFAIDPSTGRITVADGSLLDFETRPQYTIEVIVTDSSGVSGSATITIDLTDVSEDSPVVIDVRPGNASNTINSKSRGKIEVAILSSAGFDATSIDVESLRFGRTGEEDSVSRNPHHGIRYRIEDVDGDGRLDLVVQFETESAGLRAGDTVAFLKGRTRDGRLFEAQDSVAVK